MATTTNSFEQGLCDLLGEETYQTYFTNEPDHTPGCDQADEHVYELDKLGRTDSMLLEASSSKTVF